MDETSYELQREVLQEANEDFRFILDSYISSAIAKEDWPKAKPICSSLRWLNTSRNLTLDDDLSGRIVVMDFFTYCCINCIHILPFIKKLEDEFPVTEGLAVIGIHSAKFPNEYDTNNLNQAILKNKIEHPVVNDHSLMIFKDYNITCWPTVVILSPCQRILFMLVGEAEIEKLSFICTVLKEFLQKESYSLKTSHLPLSLQQHIPTDGEFHFPVDVCSNDVQDIFIVADTGNHRLIILTRDGRVKEQIGNGISGFKDGSYQEAHFNFPCGVVWRKPDLLYVSDTGNHCIRLVNLSERQVSTLFGDPNIQHLNKGDKSSNGDVNSFFSSFDASTFISPWGLCLAPPFGSDVQGSKIVEDVLYIAAAGSHQIWALQLHDYTDISGNCYKKGLCAPIAGSGKEENRNNYYRHCASFAQPSSIAYSAMIPEYLFVADSESSSIRKISICTGVVSKVVGGDFDPFNLFAFGDIDGTFSVAKLQHPLGVCVYDTSHLLVADSYNHKIKLINLDDKTIEIYAGDGVCANKIYSDLLKCSFNEPSGIHMGKKGNFLIADTNNHCIKIIDAEKKVMSELKLLDPDSWGFDVHDCSTVPEASHLNLQHILLKPGGKIKMFFYFKADAHIVLDKEQRWKLSINGSGDFDIICQASSLFGDTSKPSLILESKLNSEGLKEVILEVSLYLCDSKNKACMQRAAKFKFFANVCNMGYSPVCLNLKYSV